MIFFNQRKNDELEMAVKGRPTDVPWNLIRLPIDCVTSQHEHMKYSDYAICALITEANKIA